MTALQIIVPHTNTDLDALGAAVGAQVLYPQAVIVLPGRPSPLAAEFLSLHRYNIRVKTGKEIDLEAVTRAIVVDTADPARLGTLQPVADRAEIHLYDHHPPEPDDLPATLEVRDLVGATCTLVAELIQESGAPLSPVQATAMLLGIYADTGSLTLLGTTARDAAAAAFLLGKGANLRAVARFIQGTLSPPQVALLHQLQERGRWLTVRRARIRVVEAETEDYIIGLALVVHRLLEIEPAHALFAVVRMADRVHVVARSEVPWVNAARVAAAFGGGGHASAAAGVAKGVALSEAVKRLEATLDQVVEQPKLAVDVMSLPVKTIVETKPVREAERLMLRHGHSGLPVVSRDGHLVGMISLRDVDKAHRHGHGDIPVKGMMIRQVVTVSPEMPLDEVQDLMIVKDIGRVPVVDQFGQLVGIISRSDLLGEVYGGPVPRWHRTLYAASGATAAGGSEDPVAVAVHEAVGQAPPPLRSLLRLAGAIAERMGLSIYAVGGFVRDLLLRRPNLDLDIVVEGDGPAFARALGEAMGGTVKEVPRFETAHIFIEEPLPDTPARIDVSTARREYYEHAAALPLVEHADLREDLYRRDFSINAMAIPLGPRGPLGLVDFFGGWADLQSGQVRILHTLSFVEDPTRILRAVRFAHRYGFRLEPETARCAASAVTDGLLARVSMERLRNELLLILQEKASSGAIQMLHDLGVLERMVPGVLPHGERLALVDRVESMGAEVGDIYTGAEPWLVKLMLLLHSLPLHSGLKAAKGLKLRREQAQALTHALTCWQMAEGVLKAPRASRLEVVRALSDWTPTGLLMLYLLGCQENVLRYWRLWRHVKLAITGRDLLDAGVPAGPRIKQALDRVLSDCLDGRSATRESQLALALRYAKEEE